MTTWLVTRHAGAIDWLQRHYGMSEAYHVDHLDTTKVRPGDDVVGTLPMQAVAEVCARGARYHHLQIPMTRTHRGRELSADDLDDLGATLEGFEAYWTDHSSSADKTSMAGDALSPFLP